MNSSDTTTTNLKKGDIVYIDNNDKFNGEYIVEQERGTATGQSGNNVLMKLTFVKNIKKKNIYSSEGNKSNFKTGDTGTLKLKFNKHGSNTSGNAGKFDIEKF